MIDEVLFIVLGYLSGSIPFGYVYSAYVAGENIREKGSGNIGATNILRNFGWIPGLLTLVLDAAKGAVPAGIACYLLFPGQLTLALVVGGAAIFGHIFPIYLGFSGGKGVATSAGVFLTLAPAETMIALLVFAVGVVSTRYMSVGSLLGALTLPVVSAVRYGADAPLTIAAVVLAAMIVWRHRGNIRRLYRGDEHTFF